MTKVIFYEENPKYPKTEGRGRKPSRFIIKIQTQHDDGRLIDRPVAYANTNSELRMKLRDFIKSEDVGIEVHTNTFLYGKKKAKTSTSKVPAKPNVQEVPEPALQEG